MLAGRMKLKNFLLLAGVLGAGVVAFGVWTFSGRPAAPPPLPPPRASIPPPAVPVSPPPGTPTPPPTEAPTTPATSVRVVDRLTLGFRGKDLRADKWKDATKGEPFKVNLYQDPGHTTTNRAKIDLDRDDKWDEKWTFDGEQVLREVAPNDDEQYTLRYTWDGQAWKAQ